MSGCKDCELMTKALPEIDGCVLVSGITAQEALEFIVKRYSELSRQGKDNLILENSSIDELDKFADLISQNIMETYAKMIPLVLLSEELPFDRMDLLEAMKTFIDETMLSLGYSVNDSTMKELGYSPLDDDLEALNVSNDDSEPSKYN